MVNGAVCGFLVLGVGTKDGWTNSTQTEKGTRVSEFRFSFFRVSEFRFSFLRGKEKRTRAFLNAVFLFSAERKKKYASRS